jgi:hypothetical protein
LYTTNDKIRATVVAFGNNIENYIESCKFKEARIVAPVKCFLAMWNKVKEIMIDYDAENVKLPEKQSEILPWLRGAEQVIEAYQVYIPSLYFANSTAYYRGVVGLIAGIMNRIDVTTCLPCLFSRSDGNIIGLEEREDVKMLSNVACFIRYMMDGISVDEMTLIFNLVAFSINHVIDIYSKRLNERYGMACFIKTYILLSRRIAMMALQKAGQANVTPQILEKFKKDYHDVYINDADYCEKWAPSAVAFMHNKD